LCCKFFIHRSKSELLIGELYLLFIYRYICDICGDEIDGETVNGLVETAQNHLVNVHGLQDSEDVAPTNLVQNEELLKERTFEVVK